MRMEHPQTPLPGGPTPSPATIGTTESDRGARSDLAPVEEGLAFGAFRLLVAQRRLERDGAPVPIGGKAFDILTALVERAGEVVGKTELLRQAWPDSIADDGSLRFHIATLRKVLGEGRFVATIAGRGYCFVAPVSRDLTEQTVETGPKSARPMARRTRPLVGRDEVLSALRGQLIEHRFVTIVGPGGVGKTSVALALAHDLATHFDGDVCFFDAGSVFEPELFVGGLASALGIPARPAEALPGIIPFLHARRMLLVLDGCEPVVDAAAALAEKLICGAPRVHLLATSREALRADGEYVHRLFPLSYPAADTGRSATEALEFSAVRLFVDRVTASQHAFVLTDEDAPLVSAICRKLDGLALAIELAAGRVEVYGIPEVARQLESRFALMWPGRRTAVARHQTLSATLGWSHELLSEPERVVFRRLSIFAGAFTLKMATAVVQDESVSQAEVTDLLGGLVSKSLVQFEMDGSRGAYRLLDMTRSYALEKLTEANEVRFIAERHARLIRRWLESGDMAQDASRDRAPVDLLSDVRAALEWSLSPEGDGEVAAALAASSAPIWLQSGLLTECRFWMARTLESVGAKALGGHQRLAMQAALASALMFTQGFSDASLRSWSSTLTTAQSVANAEQQLISLVVLWAHRIRSPDYPEALSLARQVDELAVRSSDPEMRAMADWMVGITHHHLGELQTAKPYLERALAGDTLEAREAMMTRFGYDRRIPTLGVLSNLLWLEGRPDQALRVGAMAVTEAKRSPFAVPICEALTWQALNLHFCGRERAGLELLLDEASAHARSHFIESYHGLSLAIKGLNAAAHGDTDAAALIGQGLELLSTANYEVFHPLFQSERARLKVQAGVRLRDGEVDDLLQLEKAPEHWASAEVRRNLGEVLLHRGQQDRAKRLFADAIDLAERQGAVAWGLRAALSLARSETEAGARSLARSRVAALRAKITEGAGTADVQAATLFLAS
jgi:predicted ATPase/DNA-binding winged helix-turn-helix (wHTH) protein